MRKPRVADLFCGAGGTSIGAAMTGGVNISFAVNHWDIAIKTHSRNFPNAKHVEQSLKWVHPSEADKINFLFASPECTHHSKARGGRPTSNQQRAGAWELMPWIEYHRPSHIVVENVTEFEEWGPVNERSGEVMKSKRGAFFEAWIAAIQSAGYRVTFRRLNAADYGAATSRERLFIVAKKGNREPCWPEPSHCKDNSNCLPGFELQPWRGAMEIIDWSIPLPSVFLRKRPLADNTLMRINKGLERHVAPFITKYNGLPGENDARNHDTSEPLRTLDTSNRFGVVAPMVVQYDNGSGVRTPRDINSPTFTLTTKAGQAVAVPIITTVNHGGDHHRSRPATEQLPTMTSRRGEALTVPIIMSAQAGGAPHDAETHPVPTVTVKTGAHLAVPFIASFYGTHNSSTPDQPVPTVTTIDRHAAAVAALGSESLPEPRTDAEQLLQDTMRRLGVFDIGFRMLTNAELANAQGFPMNYEFCGSKKQVTKQVGNSVSPPVAKAITEALLG